MSTDPATPLLCIGDINKQQSQFIRSGGLACIVDKVIYNAWGSLVDTTDQPTTLSEQ